MRGLIGTNGRHDSNFARIEAPEVDGHTAEIVGVHRKTVAVITVLTA